MNILISGGSGFLGSAFSETVMKRYQTHSEVVRITWLTRNSNQDCPDAIRLINYDDLAKTHKHFDVIINLAGAGIADWRWTDNRKEKLLASRVGPTESILAFIERSKTKPKLLVSGSAIGWYGTQGDRPLTESSRAETDFAHQLCEDWEQLALKATEYGVPVAIVRTGVVIHPDGGMLGKLLIPFKLRLGGQLGDGQQIMSWISRDDWVGAAIFIIKRQLIEQDNVQNGQPATQLATDNNAMKTGNNTLATVYNLTAPNPVTNRTFTKAVGAWLGRPTFLNMPRSLLAGMFGDMSTLLVDGQKVLPQALLDAGYEFQHPTLEEALDKQRVAD